MRTEIPVIAILLVGAAALPAASENSCAENISFQSWDSDDGVTLAEGKASKCGNWAAEFRGLEANEVKEWELHFRSGTWTYRYGSGAIRARAVYSIQGYTHCCAGGYCSKPYERLDELTLWGPDGELIFDSPLKRRSVNHYSACQGGEKIRIGWFDRKTKLRGDAESVSLGGIQVRDILPSYTLLKPAKLWSSVSHN